MITLFSKRHFAKTISWRIVGTIDTLIFTFILSEDLNKSLEISIYTIFTKTVWYYIHERIWYRVNLRKANYRHFLKTLTWRSVGSLDTIIISFLLLGNTDLLYQIAGAETVSKTVLYYLHEKLWYNSNFGLDKRNNNE